MARYLAKRIFDGYQDYDHVIELYPQYKDGIDDWLRRWGWEGFDD